MTYTFSHTIGTDHNQIGVSGIACESSYEFHSVAMEMNFCRFIHGDETSDKLEPAE